jgi:WD40 repeat protein
VWDLIKERLAARMPAHTNWFFGVAFSPSGDVLATGGSDQLIHLWEVPSQTNNSASWRRISTLRGPLQEIWSLSFSADSRWLASAGKDRTAKLWSTVPQADPVFALTTPPGSTVIGFSRNGERLLTIDRTGGIQFSSVAGKNRGHQAARSGLGPGAPQQASTPTPDQPGARTRLPEDASFYQHGAFPIYLGDETLVFGTAAGAVKFWNPNTDAIMATHQISTSSISVLQLSRDQRRILVWHRSERLAALWNLETGEREAAFPDFARSKADERSMKRAAFSPDGRWLSYASTNYFVKVWDIAARQPRFVLPAHAWTINHLRFSPDSRVLGSASWDGHARLWDLDTGNEKISLARGYLGTVMTLSFSPDGRTLVTSTSDSTVQFWSVDTGRHLLTVQNAFVEHETLIAPDGSSLIWERSGVARVTPLPALRDIDAAQAQLTARR